MSPLLAKVPEVARARVSGPTLVVEQIARRHHTKGTDNGQVARFGATKRILTVAVVDELTFETAWQVQSFHEHVARPDVAVA